MKPSLCILVIFTNIFSNVFLFAQTKAPQNEACSPQMARLLVEQQVAESKMVEETDKRVKILLRSADFLWKYDEPAGRKFFKEAFDTANARFKEKGFAVKKADAKTDLITPEPDYRMTVIGAIAKKDGEWAKRLSEQILKDFEADADNRKDWDKTREISSLLAIATENAETNPALSQYLLRRAMRYPLDQHWFYYLYALAGKNKNLPDSVYAELLQNYQNETPRRLLFLSAYPFASTRIFGIDKFQYGSSIPENFAPNPNLQARFFDTFFRRVANFANNPEDINRPAETDRLPETAYISSALAEMEPVIQRDFPNLYGRFNAAKSQAAALLSEQTKNDLEASRKNYESAGLTFAERLKKLEAAESENKLRDSDIVSLLIGLKKEEEFKEAEPWLEKIRDDDARKNTVNYFYFRRSQIAREEKRFDDARKHAQKVEELEHRAILFFELANEQMKNQDQSAPVSDVLGEVSQLARKSDDSVEKAQVLLGLSLASEKLNHQTALYELAEAIKIINRLDNPNIFSETVTRQIKTKNSVHFALFSTPGFNLETAFREISKNDFELTLAHARNMNDKYFRTIAVIAVVKNCVENAEKKTPTKTNPK